MRSVFQNALVNGYIPKCPGKCFGKWLYGRRWNAVKSILPEGGSGETNLHNMLLDNDFICGIPDSQRPATHCKYNITSLQKRNKYNIFVRRVGRESAPYHGHWKTDRPPRLCGPKTEKRTIY